MTSRLMKGLAAFLLVMGIMALPAHAGTLATFIGPPGTTITVAPLSFTGIPPLQVSGTQAGSFDPTAVMVSGVTTSNGSGIEFSDPSGPMGGVIGANQFLEVDFGYKVTANPGTLIDDLSMSILSASATGTGQVDITENVFADAAMTNELASLYTYVLSSGSTSKSSDNLALCNCTQHTTLYVAVDILFIGGTHGTTGTASLSEFEQNFAAPEPATLALACSGLPVLGLFWARRHRAK